MAERIFVTRAIPEAGLAPLRDGFEVELRRGDLPPSREELADGVRGAAGLLCLLTDPVDAEVISAGGDLRVISNYAVGHDNIDVDAATARGIPVGNTPDVLTETTADLAFALLLSAARRIPEGAEHARSGGWLTWSPTLLLGRDVHRATLGLLGLGRIGRAVARRARGFDMEVLYFDPFVPYVDLEGVRAVGLDELLERSDFLSLHCPLNERTRGIVGERTLRAMKPTAILVNTARGALVDHDALYEALAAGRIAGAALDVTEPEPLPAGHRLYDLPSCLIVPHVGSASVATRDLMAAMAAENLLAGLRGERLPHCVNPQVYG